MHRPHFLVAIINVLYLNIIRISSTEILFPGEKYLSFKNERGENEVEYVNRIELKFRTFHPTGLLVLMIGPYNDVIALQLNHGSLRLVTLCQSKSTRDVYEIFISKNLNDNKWHTIGLLRTNRLNEIQVDQDTKTLLLPLSFDGLSFGNIVYLGGYDLYNHQALNTIIHAEPTFSGCLDIIEIDNQNPILNNDSQTDSQTSHMTYVPSGKLIFQCDDPDLLPIGFQKPTSYADIYLFTNTSKDAHLFTIFFSIRTFSNTGFIFETDENSGTQMFMREGKIVVLVNSYQEKQPIQLASDQKISDGFWHNIMVTITTYGASLIIDNKDVESVHVLLVYACVNPVKIHFGYRERNNDYSFVGCLHRIKIREKTMDIFERKPTIKTSRRNHVKRGCMLSNKCFPNPCLHGGICTQTWNEYSCHCTNTDFIGKRCEKTIFKSSCAAYKRMGLDTTSFCLIDPDGNGPLRPYTTLCQFTRTNEVYTIVNHNKMSNFTASAGDERFHQYTFHKLKYDLDFKNIQLLITRSKSCRQQLSFFCYNTPLLNAPYGPPNVVWKTSNGHLKRHWGGVPSNGTGCACGITRSCINPDKLCNCDSYNNKWMQDTGFINDKDNLPVTRLDVTEMDFGLSVFNIGPLECIGELDTNDNSNNNNKNNNKELLSHVCVSTSKRKRLIESAIQSVGNFKNSGNNPITPPEIYPKPTGMPKDGSPGRLSSLELVLISIACASIVLIVIKFTMYVILNKLNGQVVLNHDRAENDNYLLSPEKKRTISRDRSNTDGSRSIPSTFWV